MKNKRIIIGDEISNGINRRNFLSSLGIGTMGTFSNGLFNSKSSVTTNKQVHPLSKIEKGTSPRDLKINVKPVACYMIHAGVWTGPCRWKPNSPPSEEQIQFRNLFEKNVADYKTNLSTDVNLLDPVYLEFPEATGFCDRQLKELESDTDHVDLYLMSGNIYPQYAGSLIGERYKKPVAIIGEYWNWDLSARLRSKNLEGFSPENIDELNGIISILRARKIFQQTNLLVISDIPFKNRPAPSANVNFQELNERFGLRTTIIGYHELSEERDQVINSQEMMSKVEDFTDDLIKNAEEVRIKRDMIIPNIVFHFAVKNLMKKYECNAFTIECFEFCSSKLSHDWKVVPCLTHSLLKDEGFTSGCEGDINAALAMDMLMGVAKRSAYMGNLYIRDEETMYLMHNVPALKMMGYDKPDLPYALQNFIESGWGPKVQMDLSQFDEKTVTIARCNPLTSKILLIKGEIVGCQGQDDIGCSLKAHIKIPDNKSLVAKARNYGFHYAMVYGDYTKDVIELADMLKIEVETHNV